MSFPRAFTRLSDFFFAPVTATGFGMMRAAFGLVTFLTFLSYWGDVSMYFSDAGIMPRELAPLTVRTVHYFSLLDISGNPAYIFALYLAILLASLLTMSGVRPRWSTIATVVLMYSFHERNPLILGGGDTLLRLVGFILAIAPGIDAFSVERLRLQWKHWKETRALLPPVLMPVWPYRMLLWQFMVLYGTSLWFKSTGTMWFAGTAAASALHHPVFARFPSWLMDGISPLTPLLTYGTLVFHALWLLLLIPHPLIRTHLRRLILCAGLLLHGSIFLLMDAGNFSLVLFTGYLGLLHGTDIEALRARIARRHPANIAVLYDGRCGLCLRSVFWLTILDRLHRLTFVNFRDAAARQAVAPDIAFEDLDRSMHIRYQGGRTLHGFDAFRSLAAHLPPLWIVRPFLWMPGVGAIGRRVYAGIATRRQRCGHDGCAL